MSIPSRLFTFRRLPLTIVSFSPSQQQTEQQAWRRGIKDAVPSAFGLMPFGLIVGAASTAAGLDPWLALAMSVIVFAGASQLAAIALMAQSAPMLIVVVTVVVVNLRFMMYSAALAPYFRGESTAKKWLLAYALTDHLFALLTTRYRSDDPQEIITAYYSATAIVTWTAWQVMVAIGIFAGTLLPKAWSLDFAIPLVFMALVFPAFISRAHWWTGGVAALAAFFTVAMPMKLGLIVAAVVGVAVGCWLDIRREAQLLANNDSTSGDQS